MEDGGASGIPTEQATDKYKVLGACAWAAGAAADVPTGLVQSGVCIKLATFRS